MTFEEARRYLIGNFENMNLVEVVSVLASVREEYAPTIEMTKGQEITIKNMGQKDSLLNLLGNGTGYFDYLFWDTLTEKQVVQAWLHPESIKVVDK